MVFRWAVDAQVVEYLVNPLSIHQYYPHQLKVYEPLWGDVVIIGGMMAIVQSASIFISSPEADFKIIVDLQ